MSVVDTKPVESGGYKNMAATPCTVATSEDEAPIKPQPQLDPADFTALLSWLDELTFADTYTGFAALKWIRRRPFEAIVRLNDALKKQEDASTE